MPATKLSSEGVIHSLKETRGHRELVEAVMAVLRMRAEATRLGPIVPTSSVPSSLTKVFELLTRELPEDVRGCECSMVVLFRGSQVLNFVSGGNPEMTFSARCHRSRRTSRSIAARAGWSALVIVIDTACGAIRGEVEHCATAWTNYAVRPSRRLPR